MYTLFYCLLKNLTRGLKTILNSLKNKDFENVKCFNSINVKTDLFNNLTSFLFSD